MVRPVGFEDCYAGRKSSARGSVAIQPCVRKCERRDRPPEACRPHFGYARPRGSRWRCGGNWQKDECETGGNVRFAGGDGETSRVPGGVGPIGARWSPWRRTEVAGFG